MHFFLKKQPFFAEACFYNAVFTYLLFSKALIFIFGNFSTMG